MQEFFKRYLQEDELTYVDVCRRVARAVATDPLTENEYFECLIHKEFIPSSMILLTAGEKNPCFASDIAISWNEREITTQALAHGLGVSLHIPDSESFDGLYAFLMSFKDTLQRDFRPGATMVSCFDTHPDVETFIQLKNTHRDLTHVNFSVLISDKKNLEKVVLASHACGDPGVVFASRMQPFIAPCGQNQLHLWQSVFYAHLNLASFVSKGQFVVADFLSTLTTLKKFLSDCSHHHTYFSEKNEIITKENCSIGVGVMGLQELVNSLNTSFDSPSARQLMSFIARSLGEQGVISPTGATSRLLGVTPNIEQKHSLAHGWKSQLDIAALFQKHIGGAISKTILLPYEATIQEVLSVMEYAYEKELKGITVFRINSLEEEAIKTE